MLLYVRDPIISRLVNAESILLDDEEIISDSTNCAEISNNYFTDIAINLDVDRKIQTVSTPVNQL